MKHLTERITLRNIGRWEILEYLERLDFHLEQDGVYRRDQVYLRLSETCKTELCSLRIDETQMELEGPQDLVEELAKEIRFHFMRAGG